MALVDNGSNSPALDILFQALIINRPGIGAN